MNRGDTFPSVEYGLGYLSDNEPEYPEDISVIQTYLSEEHEAETVSEEFTSSSSTTAFSESTSSSPMSNHRVEKRNASHAFGDEAWPPPTKKSKGINDDKNLPVIIAHCPAILQLLEAKQLAWGVQFEIARLVSKGLIVPRDITAEKLEQLRGSNNDAAARVTQVFVNTALGSTGLEQAFAKEMAASSPWEELDREQEALSLGPYEGLGNNPKFPGWHGGKVVFQGQLLVEEGKYRIVLDSCSIGGSCRFSRRFGSWSFLRIKLPQSIFFGQKRDFIPFFLRPFIIWGRVFRVFDAKDCKVFLYWTDECVPSGSSIPGRMSFEEFIDWHNPLKENKNQLMTKWAARMCLGLSTSVPGPCVLPENILSEEDLVSDEGSDMTDGCGLSSKNIHVSLSHMFSLSSTPAAFQFRLAGCKGMSLLRDDSSCSDNQLRVWFRPSQVKIKYTDGDTLDPAKLTFDILRLPVMRSPAQISSEVIMNLAENSVPSDVFVRLLVDSIQSIVQSLTSWDGPDAMFKLWINVERAGGVLPGRRARESIGDARVRGYTNKSPDEIELELNDDENDEDLDQKTAVRRSTAWWTDYISGCPSSLEETIMVMLDAGFTPQKNPLLREKLHKVISSKIENRMQNIRFDVEESCIAFAVPDPYHVLGPNEIQIKSSRRNLKTNDSLLTDTILGNVLVTRNPCKIPTDVRKVKAVEHPALRNLVDVIVFSVDGLRRLIDFLAGGDYDGDKVLVIWKNAIVDSFQNSDEKHATEPAGLDLAFEREKETVADFLIRTAGMTKIEKREAVQGYLLGPLVDPALRGKYSNMHINAIYKDGYSNPRTVKLAYKVLDAAKTGWRVKPASYQADLSHYHTRPPQWKEFISNKKDKSKAPKFDTSNMKYLERDNKSPFVKGKFVMDILVNAADREKQRLLVEMKRVFAPLDEGPDPDLILPWDNLVQWAERGESEAVVMKRRDLGRIAIHVHQVYRMHTAILIASKSKRPGSSHFTGLPIEERQDRLRKVSKAFASGPLLEDLPTIVDKDQLARYRASYAYKYDAEQKQQHEGWSRFPFNVAMRELCDIKARTLGTHKVVQNSFYERFKLLDRG